MVGRGVLPQTIAFRRENGQLVVCDPPPDGRQVPPNEFVELRKIRDENPDVSQRELARIIGWDRAKVQRMLKDPRFRI